MADDNERRIFAKNLNYYIALNGKQQNFVTEFVTEMVQYFFKKLKKPLDYSLRMIYNNIIKRENKRNSIPEGSGERWK